MDPALLNSINSSTGLNSTQNSISGVNTPLSFAPILSSPTPQDTTSTNTPTGTGTGGTATGGTSSSNPAWNAYWQSIAQQAGDALNRIPTQATIGHQNILDAFNSAFQTLTNQKGQEQRDYETGTQNTQNDNLTAKNNIATGVRNGLTALQRLLGANGAGSSSAYEVLAPYAAGYEGNQERQQVQTAYGRNMGAIDTSHKDALDQFDTGFGQLNADHTNKDRALDSSLDTTRIQLLNQQAQAARMMNQAPDPTLASQVNDLGKQVDQLGATATFTPPTINYKAPDLAKYSYDTTGAPVDSNAGSDNGASNVGPFWTLLNKQKQGAAV